jgi:DUF2946 family protein
MQGMQARRLGTWLAILAITLQAAWPLLVNAKPRAITLVPLCTVDGVTHYLEVPTGDSPLEKSSKAHHEHCGFCFLGQLSAVPSQQPAKLAADARAEHVAPAGAPGVAKLIFVPQAARAPPFLPARSI